MTIAGPDEEVPPFFFCLAERAQVKVSTVDISQFLLPNGESMVF